MKRTIILILGAFVLFVSCQREVKPFLGDYSYKLSGEVAITDTNGNVSYHLIHRNGQMNILEDKTSSSAVLITMNEMNGACYTISATVKNDSLILEPHEFNSNLLTQEGTSILDSDNPASLVYRITAKGGGILNGSMLMLDESWNGYQSANEGVLLSGPQMKILAEKN